MALSPSTIRTRTLHFHAQQYMVTLTEAFTRRVVGTFGQAGSDWMRRLPAILDGLATRWELRLGPPFADLSYNYVASAIRRDGFPVVLKVGVPNRELYTEIAALQIFDGEGTVRLLESEPDLGALLLERLRPGTSVLQLDSDEQTTAISAQVMQQIWKPAPERHIFPSVADWAQGLQRLRGHFRGHTGPFPSQLVDAAEQRFTGLIATMQEDVLLHGDLHHWNILSAERQPWLAIDPKGVTGEPAYEVGAWLRNPFPHILETTHPEKIIARRADQFVELLGFERQRMLDWAIAQAVLAAWWSYEEHSADWKAWMAIAELIAAIG